MKTYRKTATVQAKIFEQGDEDGFIHLASTKPRAGTEIKGEINWSLGREFTPWGFGTMPEREVKRKAEEREKKEEKEKKKKKS